MRCCKPGKRYAPAYGRDQKEFLRCQRPPRLTTIPKPLSLPLPSPSKGLSVVDKYVSGSLRMEEPDCGRYPRNGEVPPSRRKQRPPESGLSRLTRRRRRARAAESRQSPPLYPGRGNPGGSAAAAARGPLHRARDTGPKVGSLCFGAPVRAEKRRQPQDQTARASPVGALRSSRSDRPHPGRPLA